MPKWKKYETKFLVSINEDGNGGNICRIPKPVYDHLELSNSIIFEKKKNGKVEVFAGEYKK